MHIAIVKSVFCTLFIYLIDLYKNIWYTYKVKIILISDSHGKIEYIENIFNNHEFDYLFFMGDGLSDLGDHIKDSNVYAVSGNCDGWDAIEPNEKTFNIGNFRFFITHGNKYGVKYAISPLISRASEENVNVVCYGHTHRQDIVEIDNVYYINPGSLKNGLGLVLELNNKNLSINLLKI